MVTIDLPRSGRFGARPDRSSGERSGGTGHFRPEVEGLRAVAVLLVIADHLFGAPRGGFTGVDVFFTISGFLITGLLDREYERTGRISIVGFYERRARRILPGALLVLATCAVLGRSLFYASRAHQALVDALWAAGFSANIHFASIGTDYFHANRPPSPVQHYWSLSVEEQFYVVWPLLLFLLSFVAAKIGRRARPVLVVIVALLTAGLFELGLQQTRQNSTTAYFATTARAWELGVGALLALALPRRRSLPAVLRLPAFVLGLVLIACSALVVTQSSSFPAPAAAWAVAGTALVIIGGTGAVRGAVFSPLTNPVSRYIGRISYSLYLWHWPVIVFLPSLMNAHGAYYDVTAVSATAALSIASFHFVEDPLRRLNYRATWHELRRAAGHRRRPGLRLSPTGRGGRRNGLVGLGALSFFAVAAMALALQPVPYVSVATPVLDESSATPTTSTLLPGEIPAPASITTGIKQALAAFSFPKLNPSVDTVADAHGPEWKTCGNVDRATLARCTFPATHSTGKPKTLVMLGDSFGISWTPAMRAAQADGYTVVELTHSQCPAISADFSEKVGNSAAFTAQCNAAHAYYLAEIAHLKPDIVVIGNYDAMLNNLASHAKGQQAIDEWANGANTMVSKVKAAGAKRVVWLTSPPSSVDLAQCAVGPTAAPAKCIQQLGFTWTHMRAAEATVMSKQRVTMVDSELYFCSAAGYCPAFEGTTSMRTDGHHLTGRYAKKIGPYLMPYILGTKPVPS